MRTKVLAKLIGVGAVLLAVNANASLVSTDGGLGVYDTTNNVTWTSNANLFATQAASYSGGAAAFVSAVIADSGGVIHDTPNFYDPTGTYTLSASDFVTSGNFDGTMSYWGARAWVNYLDATNYGGSNQWALPTTVDNNASVGYPNGGAGNPAQSSSQMAQLFYGGLGQVANSSITTTHNANYSLFSNVQSYVYWSGTEYSADPEGAWLFLTDDGEQYDLIKSYDLYALAVSPGDVSAVPEPGAAWLLGVGLLGLVGLRRRKAETSALRSFE
jgi:hypothetical protein